MSDDGLDDNDCHSASAPCRNLQTVLDRAANGADIHVTSPTLSLNKVHRNVSIHVQQKSATSAESVYGMGCIVESKISFKLSSNLFTTVHTTCSGKSIVTHLLLPLNI